MVEVTIVLDRWGPIIEGIEARFCEGTDRERFRALMAEAEVLWHVLMPITAEVIASLPVGRCCTRSHKAVRNSGDIMLISILDRPGCAGR